jgi:hypothetical protein
MSTKVFAMSTERYEYISLLFISDALHQNYQRYIESCNHISFNEFLLYLSRQGEGRGKKAFKYSVQDVIEYYTHKGQSDKFEDVLVVDQDLRKRIAASSIFQVAIQRFVADSLIRWLKDNDIDYKNFNSPNTADYCIILLDSEIGKISGSLGIDLVLPSDFDGILISVDSKSIMGLLNTGDSLTTNSILGKFKAKWNQISYIPPRLRSARKSNNPVFNQKFSVLNSSYEINGKNFYTVSCFVCDLICLPDLSTFFSDRLENLNGSYFNHYVYTVCVPNADHQSIYYDSFLQAGKDGYENYDAPDGNIYPYPVDCRWRVVSNNGYLTYQELRELYQPRRFCYVSRNPGEYNVSVLSKDWTRIIGKKVIIP